MKAQIVQLGDRVKDKVTGLVGIVKALTTWLSGCDTAYIQPKRSKDGTVPDPVSVDIVMLTVVKKGVVKPVSKHTGGPKKFVEMVDHGGPSLPTRLTKKGKKRRPKSILRERAL